MTGQSSGLSPVWTRSSTILCLNTSARFIQCANEFAAKSCKKMKVRSGLNAIIELLNVF